MILSPSRTKAFLECSWQFYNSYFLKVPEKTHPKTKLGSLVHIILECLCKKKHKKNYDKIIKSKYIYSDPGISRLVKIYLKKNPDITSQISYDLNKLVFVALNFDFHFKGANKILDPEFEFLLDFEDLQIKGLMDRVAIYDNIAVIRDYKTQAKKFTAKELQENLQVLFYQSAIKRIFGLPARVEFVMLRHDCVQKVEPSDENLLGGFQFRLIAINNEINKLNIETAKNNLKANKDIGFCNYVCQLKNPVDYYVLIKTNDINKIITSDFNDFKLKQIKKDDEKIEKRRYFGCPYFYNELGRPRNFN